VITFEVVNDMKIIFAAKLKECPDEVPLQDYVMEQDWRSKGCTGWNNSLERVAPPVPPDTSKGVLACSNGHRCHMGHTHEKLVF